MHWGAVVELATTRDNNTPSPGSSGAGTRPRTTFHRRNTLGPCHTVPPSQGCPAPPGLTAAARLDLAPFLIILLLLPPPGQDMEGSLPFDGNMLLATSLLLKTFPSPCRLNPWSPPPPAHLLPRITSSTFLLPPPPATFLLPWPHVWMLYDCHTILNPSAIHPSAASWVFNAANRSGIQPCIKLSVENEAVPHSETKPAPT